MADPTPATLAVAASVPTQEVATSSTAPGFVSAPGTPTMSVTTSSTPAVFQMFAIPAEPEPGGDAVHGGSVGLSMSLSLALG